MKYQTKLTVCYATIALILSLTLGIVVYRISMDYEVKRQEESLSVTSAQLVSQMDERLKRMDAIIYYILSDTDMLGGIETLGKVSEGKVPSSYALNALTQLGIGFNTEYIIQNSYRTVFYNQLGDLVSSYNSNMEALSLPEDFDVGDYSYLRKAELAKGKTVLIGAHKDEWGRTEGPVVYSVMKALQGFQMGYIEVENTVESLGTLEVADPRAEFLIITDHADFLYSSSVDYKNGTEFEQMTQMEDGISEKIQGIISCKTTSDVFPFSVVAYSREKIAESGRVAMLIISTLSALVMFACCLILISIWSYKLTQPIRELRKMIEHTNLENLDVQNVQTSYGLDEVEMLADSYQAMTERLSQAVSNEKKSMMLQMQAQFDTLQAQINPHFLYNVLNIISSRGIEDEDDMICDMCGALASMLRYSTNNKERYARVDSEIQYLDNYLYLLKARYGDKIRFSITMDPEVRNQILPKMTLHQFIENTLNHGYNHTDQTMEICVVGKMYEDRWEICVRDNGEGFDREKLKELTEKFRKVRERIKTRSGNMELEIGGMGLINTYARCFLLYSDDLIFSIENLSRGVEVKIGERLADKKTKGE